MTTAEFEGHVRRHLAMQGIGSRSLGAGSFAAGLWLVAVFLFGLASGALLWRPHVAALDASLEELKERDAVRSSWAGNSIALGAELREDFFVRVPDEDPRSGTWYEFPRGCEVHLMRGAGLGRLLRWCPHSSRSHSTLRLRTLCRQVYASVCSDSDARTPVSGDPRGD